MNTSPQLRLFVSLAALAGVLNAPRQLSGDSWFNLVLGRDIRASGLITRNDLTSEGLGAACLDQQWLAHLIQYWLEAWLGLPGLVLVAAVLSSGALIGALMCAERQGASPGRTLLVGVLALGAITPQTVRAQSFALPLLAACLCVLAADARAPARRTWWLVPVTLLWANVHGSVLLAPVLAGLLALSRLITSFRERKPVNVGLLGRDSVLCAVLALGAVLTPYGVAGLDYYRSTLGNPNFRAYVGEWSALSFSEEPATAALLIAVALVSVAAYRRAPVFPLLVCAALSALTLHSARHATPLALAAAALLPAAADAALGRRLRFQADSRLAQLTRWLMPSTALLFLVGVPALVRHTLQTELRREFADRVAALAAGRGPILGDEHHSDRLLWYHPELRGRLSHDVRIEVVPAAFLGAITRVHAAPRSERSRRWLRRYDLVIVDRNEHTALWSALLESPDFALAAEDALGAAFVRSALGS